nr:hypothetical protein [Tanacetum cinerariifolium]
GTRAHGEVGARAWYCSGRVGCTVGCCGGEGYFWREMGLGGTTIEVESLKETNLEEVGLNCNHNTPLSSREVPSFDELEPQPQPLPNCPPLDASLRIKRGLKPPIKPQSPDSFRMKVLNNLTIHTPPSSFVASFYLRDSSCYYRPCIDDSKKHYGFKLGLFGHSGSLGVDFLKLEMIDDDWG